MRTMLLRIAVVMALCGATCLHAASAATPAPAAPAPAPVLTPAQAQAVLDVLNNPQKRAAFTATLESMTKAVAATAPKPAPAVVAVPLAPDSVGAQVLAQGAAVLANLTTEASAFGHVLGNLPAVWAFTTRSFNDPDARARVIEAGWHMTIVLAAAIGVELVLSRALRRPIRAIAAAAPGGKDGPAQEALAEPPPDIADADPAPDDPFPDEDLTQSPPVRAEELHEEAARSHRFSRTLRLLKRLPFVLMRLILNLIPLAFCVGIFYGGSILTEPPTRDVLRIAATAYLAMRLVTTLTRALASPGLPSLRLVHLSDEGAIYTLVWVRRLALVAALGFATSSMGQLFGLPRPAAQALMKATMLLDHAFAIIIVLQCRATVAARIRTRRGTNSVTARLMSRIAAIWHLIAIFFIAGLWLVWAADVRDGYAKMWRIFLITVVVTFVARLISIVALGGLDRAFRISPDMATRYPGLETRANRYYPLLRRTITGVLVITTLVALLQAWGLNTLAWFNAGALGGRLISTALTIAVAGLIALAVWELVNAYLERHLAHMTREAQIVKSARLRTLMPILRTLLLMALIGTFGLTVLSEIGVNIAPLLAGAGILGVALGFGSQKLVQDFITGIFLLLENAMQVGDAVTVAGLSGSVENLSIRTMRLRAGDGSVHIIPFSSVSTVTNSNRGIGNAAVTVSVPVSEDTDHVSDVLAEIAKDMRGERRFADMMHSDLQLWGVDKVDGGIVTVVGQIVCTDGGRWGVQREFNRRMNIRFKELGIKIATPMQTVIHQEPQAAVKSVSSDAEPPPDTVHESPPPSALGNTT
jgi:small-conductance mechanosensitive channel